MGSEIISEMQCGRKLGEGTFSDVYQVQGEKVVKIFQRHRPLPDEIRLWAELSQRPRAECYLPRYLGFCLRPHRVELYLAYVPAQSHPRHDLVTWLALATFLRRALAWLHEQHVAHRDIKLENILWDGTRYYLIDFGAACKWTKHEPIPRFAGTPSHWSPALLTWDGTKPEEVLPRADWWAAGVTLYELWFGRSDAPLDFTEAPEKVRTTLTEFLTS